MRWKLLIILFVVALSMVIAWYGHRYLQQLIKPRVSFARLILYILTCFTLIFAYSFLVGVLISKIFLQGVK